MILDKRAGLLATIFALGWWAGCGGSSGGSGGSSGSNAYVAVPQASAIAAFRVDTDSGDLSRVLGSVPL